MKTLYILTGPPGSGKSTYAASLGLPVYDTDLGNKDEWRAELSSSVLCTAAPMSATKQYWLDEAREQGFIPYLMTMWLPRNIARDRMAARSGLDPTQRNNLSKGVERWYKHYSRHPEEVRKTND